MEKNENGYPSGRTAPESGRNGTNGRTETPMDHINNNGTGNGNGRMGNGTQNGTQNGSMNGTGSGNGRMNDGMNGTGSGNMNGSQSGNGTMNGGRMNGNGMTTPRDGDTIPHSMNNGCGDMSDDCLDGRPLAYVYAPNQRFCMLYSAKDALDRGTLFEALYKPMEVYGRE